MFGGGSVRGPGSLGVFAPIGEHLLLARSGFTYCRLPAASGAYGGVEFGRGTAPWKGAVVACASRLRAAAAAAAGPLG